MTTMFHELLQQEGAHFALTQDQELAQDYGNWTAEFTTLKQAAGMVYLGHCVQVEVTGSERHSYLNRLCTGQLDALPAGEGRETFLTNAKGHILAHGQVFARPQSLVLRAAGAQVATILAHLNYYLIHDDVQLHDRSAQWWELLLAGPEAEAVLRQVSTILPAGHLHAVDVELAGRPVSLRRLEEQNCRAFLVAAEAETIAKLWPALRRAGASPCGHQAWEVVRIQCGWPAYGSDITEFNLPQEVGRNAQAISFHKGCYLGQETVARLDARGHVNRMLVGLRFETDRVPPVKLELLDEGRAAGFVTSAAFSPDFGTAIALGYVRRQRHDPGTLLASSLGPVRVTSLPMH